MWLNLDFLANLYQIQNKKHFIEWCLERHEKYGIDYNAGNPKILGYLSQMLISHYKELNDT